MSGVEVGPALRHHGEEKCRIQLDRPVGQRPGARDVALKNERHRRVDENLRRERVQRDRPRSLGDRLGEAPLEAKRHAELIMRERVARVQRERLTKLALTSRPVVAVEQLEDRERRMRLGGLAVERDGAFGRVLRLGAGGGGGDEAFVVASPQVGVGQAGIGEGEVGTERDRFFVLRDRLLEVVVAGAVEEETPAQARIVSLGVHRLRRRQARALGRRQPHVDRPGDRAGEFRLQR